MRFQIKSNFKFTKILTRLLRLKTASENLLSVIASVKNEINEGESLPSEFIEHGFGKDTNQLLNVLSRKESDCEHLIDFVNLVLKHSTSTATRKTAVLPENKDVFERTLSHFGKLSGRDYLPIMTDGEHVNGAKNLGIYSGDLTELREALESHGLKPRIDVQSNQQDSEDSQMDWLKVSILI